MKTNYSSKVGQEGAREVNDTLSFSVSFHLFFFKSYGQQQFFGRHHCKNCAAVAYGFII